MPKVYILINSLHGGGAERQALMLSEGIGIEKMFLLEKDIRYDVGKTIIEALSENTGASRLIRFLKNFYIPVYARRMNNLTSDGDVVISFMEKSNLVNVVSKMQGKRKAVLCERIQPSLEYGGLKEVLQRTVIRFLYPKADLIVANSLGVKDDLTQNFGVPADRVRVIYNGCQIEKVAEDAKGELDERYEGIFKCPVIINAGRLARQKGQHSLIRIFKEVKGKVGNAKLLILGDGSLRDSLIGLSKEVGLKTYSVWENTEIDEGYDVYFLGFQENPHKFISRSSLFVFPSLWEGFPNALIEAMACGVPVVSADCMSGPRELLAPDTDFRQQSQKPEFTKYGILMPVLDGKAPLTEAEGMWVDTIVDVLKDNECQRKYSINGLERVKDFDVRNITKEWEALIEKIRTA